MLGKIARDENLIFFSYFSQKKSFDISCKLSFKEETICMEWQTYFGGKKIEKYRFVIFWLCPDSGKV